ncbi:MAG: hypothetical protein AB7P01_06110 [Bacteroidia bacterium]
MEHSDSGDGWVYLLIGGIAPWAMKAVGLMVTSDLGLTILMSAVGAATAWTVRELLNYIKKKFTK